MKKFKVVEFSSFDGSISEVMQFVLDNKMLYNEPLNAVRIDSITLGTQYISDGYNNIPYVLAVVVFELGDE